jgi:predicted esterase
MIDRILRVDGRPLGCILTLPGRGGTGRSLAEIYKGAELKKTMIVGMTPHPEWYPAPHGPDDQIDAVTGLTHAVKMVEKVLKKIRKGFGIKKEEVVLVGFSAGGVVALETMARSKYPFAAVVCHSGAILDPQNFPVCKFKKVPIYTTHCCDDDTFSWLDRYCVLCTTLKDRGYYQIALEHARGGHAIFKQDIIEIANGVGSWQPSLARHLGYSADWRHSQAHLALP